jgi:hypothetical protein
MAMSGDVAAQTSG